MAKVKTKTPLLVLLTDTHLSESNIEVNKSVFRQAREYAKQHKLKEIFHAGDIFQSRKGQSQDVLDAFTQILDGFEKDEITLIAIPGNHDKQDYNLSTSYLTPYRQHKAFILHERFAWMERREVGVYMMPFFADDAYLARWYVSAKKLPGKQRILITHIGMNGAVMNNGIAIQSKINESLYKDFDLVLIGHYHNASAYSNKIKYVGSSIQHNHGETPNKGLTVLYEDLSIETVELDFPRYINYEVDVNKLTLKDIQSLKDEGSKDHIRITLTGAEKDIKAYDATKLKAIGVDVKKKEDKIVASDIEKRTHAFNDVSLLDAFTTFCDTNKLDHTQGLIYLNKALAIPTIADDEIEED